MSDNKAGASLENVKESKTSTERRKRLGSAVDRSAMAIRTSSIEVSESNEVDDVPNDVAEVPTEDRRVFLETRKGRLCLGLVLGILLTLLIAGIIIACFLPSGSELEKRLREELKKEVVKERQLMREGLKEDMKEDMKHQIGPVKKCVSPNVGFMYSLTPKTSTDGTGNRFHSYSAGAKVIFDNKRLDTSDGTPMSAFYDSNKGVFTCPVAGIYRFSLHVTTLEKLAQFSLNKNQGEWLATALADDRTVAYDWDSATASATVELAKGDTVSVWSRYDSTVGQNGDKGIYLNTFSGYLVRSSDCDF